MAPRRRHPQIEPTADAAGVNRRRSPRLHPQIHASEVVAAGMSRPTGTSPAAAAASLPGENGRSEQGARVASLRPQIHPSDEDVGVTRRLHPQVHASEEDSAGVARRVRSTSPAAADASLPDDDDMLREILLRLPLLPSSLPRASAVCKRWLGLVTDPKFHRLFFAHHRKPPLLGVLTCSSKHGIVFDPILARPDRIPPDSFSLGSYSWSRWSLGCRVPMRVLHCRHGLLLLKNESGTEVVVCDPITGDQLRLAIPPELRTKFLSGAVLCAASDLDHVHGGCHSSHFKLVLVSSGTRDGGDLACVYSSETGVWGDLISTGAPCWDSYTPAILVGNCLYWLALMYSIVEFDLDDHSLTMIEAPLVTFETTCGNSQIIQVEDGVVGFAALSYPRFQMWRRNVNGQGAATWVHWKTIAMCTVLGLPSPTERLFARKLGYNEDTDVLFLHVGHRVYMVQLKSMQSTKLHKLRYGIDQYYPFTSFCTPVSTAIADESNGAEIVHNT